MGAGFRAAAVVLAVACSLPAVCGFVLERRIIVKYRGPAESKITSFGSGLGSLGSRVRSVKQVDERTRVLRVEADSVAALGDAVAEIQHAGNVQYVEEDTLKYPSFVPNDPLLSHQSWHYDAINLEHAWDVANGEGTVVAVVDTGVLPHADLVDNLLPGYDAIADAAGGSDPGDHTFANECRDGKPARPSSWHGTHVAGTVAAVTDNGVGVAGVAYGSKILPVRVMGKCGGYTSDIAEGVLWASGIEIPGKPVNPNPADVINLSLGGRGACERTMQEAVDAVRARGVIVVTSAGNENTAALVSPASCDGVINVLATNAAGGRATYSNYGDKIDVAAPGGDVAALGFPELLVVSTFNTGQTVPEGDAANGLLGTSMAAPHVSGVAALIRSVRPDATPDQVETIIKDTAAPFKVACNLCSTGIVDAVAALGVNPLPPDSGLTVIRGISGAQGDEHRYFFHNDQTRYLEISISGGTGDADLYVRFGSEPTKLRGEYDCRPYENSNQETCKMELAEVGVYHVLVVAFRDFSGASLEVKL